MKVQTRLVFLNTILFSILFIVISIIFIFLYIQFSKKAIYQQLKHAANISAIFHLEEDELEPTDFANVTTQFHEFVGNVYYQVYDDNNAIKYGVTVDSIPQETLDLIRNNNVLNFKDQTYYCYGIFYHDNEGDFVVVAKERKDGLINQVKTLTISFLACLLLGLVLIIVSSKLIAKHAYKPFRNIIKEATDIIERKKQDLHLVDPHTNDELEELIQILNKLLGQLEEIFIIQKNFVRYVTHEFKTPLASIVGNLEVFSIKDRTPDEYRQLASKLVDEVNSLNNILNTLLAISATNNQEKYVEESFRADELIWAITERIKQSNNQANIIIEIDEAHLTDVNLTIKVNRTQLDMALTNLIENAVKYSTGKPVNILLSKKKEHLLITIEDRGIGIPKEQIQHLSKPFYRADNASSRSGSGIGLSIALRILETNKIKCTITSELNVGTKVFIEL